MSAFTPGPWEVLEHRPGSGVNRTAVRVVRSDRSESLFPRYVAECIRYESLDEARANASLIAAAPSMVHALETVLFGLTKDAYNNGDEIDRCALIGVVREALKAAGVAA